MKRFFILLVLLFSVSAHAAYTGRYVYKLTASGPYNANYYPVLLTACTDAYNYNKANKINWSTSSGPLYMSGINCRYEYTPTNTITIGWSQWLDCSGVYTSVSAGTATAPTCAGDQPQCTAGQTFVNGSCQSSCASKKGQKESFTVNGSSSIPGAVCMGDNCAANASSSTLAFLKSSNTWYGEGVAIYTGESCSGQPSVASFSNPSNANPAPADAPETKCIKEGSSFGYVNGVAVCVPKSSAGATPTTTTSNSTTTTTTTNPNNGQSTTESSSQVKNVTQDGGMVTSTTTTKNPDGSTTEQTSTVPTGDFCATNPNHSICKTKDEEDSDVCADNPDLPQCFERGEPEEGDPIGEQSKTVTFTPVAITSGGGCPSDKSVSIAGRSINFSYSWLCQYAEMFKPFMLAFAYLSAAMFLFWGYKGAQT